MENRVAEVKGVTVSRGRFQSDQPILSWASRAESLRVEVNDHVLGKLTFVFGERAITGLYLESEWAKVVEAARG